VEAGKKSPLRFHHCCVISYLSKKCTPTARLILKYGAGPFIGGIYATLVESQVDST